MSERQYTRQLATIIAIDAVGFSRLMGEDDEAAVAAFEERASLIRQVCERFGGRVFGIAGDSIMAEFGTPIEALRAVLDFQAAICALNETIAPPRMRMAFRTGINTGDVIVRGDLLFGDDVNVAARVQEWAPPGGVALSGTAWHHIKDKTETDFTDLGSFELKNIAFPVQILIAGTSAPREIRVPAGANGFTPPPAANAPPSIAVLPFRCEPDHAFMADGIAEDIIYGLSATRWLTVIAKGSSFQFRDASLGSRFVGKALGAQYLVSGTLTRDNGRIGVGVTLEDASNGRLFWSQRFDRPLDGISELQSEIGSEIVTLLEKEVDRVEQARTFQIPWESLQTWQLVRRGRWHMGRRTRQDTELALKFFEHALEEDAGSSTTLNEIAWWYFWRAWLRFGANEDLDRTIRFANRALLVDPMDARPHAHLGVTEIMRGNPKVAIEHLDQALHLNPSFAFARSALGSARILLGQAQPALPCFRGAERLSPFDLYGFHNLGELTAAHCMLEDWDGAIATADRSANLSPAYFYPQFLKIGALARKGETERAASERAAFEQRHPNFTDQQIRWIPFADKAITEAFLSNFALAENQFVPDGRSVKQLTVP